MTFVAGNNRLPILAADIRREHEAVGNALKDSLRHALAAGELLVEAKTQVPHGQWLPWLRDHCTISERTAQLYMRVAKNRPDIESQIRNDVADLTLSEAAALLALSSDVRKLFRFIKSIEDLGPEETIEAALAANIPIIQDAGYDPFHGKSETEKREWRIFALFLVKHYRWSADSACGSLEWIIQRPFQNVAEWLGEEGDKFRRNCRMSPMPPAIKEAWASFLPLYAESSIPELDAELGALAKENQTSRHTRAKRRAQQPRGVAS